MIFFDNIIKVTDVTTNNIPIARFEVKGSPKTITPTQTAVTGSIAPSRAVAIEPI